MTDMSNDARAYYAGGFRRTFDGAPCKVFSRRTKDGRYVNAKDSPFYVAEFDHPTKGASRTLGGMIEPTDGTAPVVEAVQGELVPAIVGAPSVAEVDALLDQDAKSNVVTVDFTPALTAANDKTAELQAVGAIVRGGFGSTARLHRCPSIQTEETNMPRNAPETPVERDEAPAAPQQPEAPDIAPVAASGAPVAPFKGLRAILAARDSLQARRRRDTPRERLLRRYLAMRAERDRSQQWKADQTLLREQAGHRLVEATTLAKTAEHLFEQAARNWRNERRKRKALVSRALKLRHQRALDRIALAAAGDAAREAREEATRAAAKPPQHPNDETADAALIAQLHRERAEAAARVKAAEDREGALRLAFDAATDRLAAKLEEMTGRALRAEAGLRLARVGTLPMPGLSMRPTARLARGRLN